MIEKIREIGFFNNIPESRLVHYASYFQERKYKKGSFPFNSDNTKSRFYLLIKGILKVYQTHPESGREFTIFLLKSGDIFDIITLMDEEEHDVQTEVLEELTVYTIDIAMMRELMQRESSILKALLPHVGKRLRKLEESAINFAIADTSARLSRMIISNFKENIQLSHDEIAKLIGTTRAVVNRHLQEIKKLGVIDIKRRKILIQKHEELKKLAQILD